jgi:hypothetical protein
MIDIPRLTSPAWRSSMSSFHVLKGLPLMASMPAISQHCSMMPAALPVQTPPMPAPPPPCHGNPALGVMPMGPMGADAFTLQRLSAKSPHTGVNVAYRATIQPSGGLIVPGSPTTLTLRLQSAATGLPPAALEIVHEKPVHMFIVSQDLSDFQHVHPTVVGPGQLAIPANFKKTGPYSIFAQFKPTGEPQQTTANRLQVPGASMPAQPLILDTSNTKTRMGTDQTGLPQAYTYQIANLPRAVGQPVRFQVNILKNEQPVGQVEPFLGAAGHAIMLSANHDNFIHAHAMDGIHPAPQQPACHQGATLAGPPSVLHFESDEVVTRPGTYRAWIQAKVDGSVRTIDWTFQVPG